MNKVAVSLESATNKETPMKTKLSIVREHMAAGRWQEAIRVAAKFPQLGEHRAAILDAHTALTNPRWTVGLGRNVDADVAVGRAALLARFGQ